MTDEKKKDNINIPDDIEELLDELLDMEEKAAEEAEGEPSEVMALPMIPLRGLHIFPNMVLHFDVGREKSVKALETAMVTNQKIFLTSQKDEDVELPVKDDYYSIGVVAKIKQIDKISVKKTTLFLIIHSYQLFLFSIANATKPLLNTIHYLHQLSLMVSPSIPVAGMIPFE